MYYNICSYSMYNNVLCPSISMESYVEGKSDQLSLKFAEIKANV